MKNIYVKLNEVGERTDIFLMKKFPSFSRTQIQKGISDQKIKSLNLPIKPAHKITSEDKFLISDDFFDQKEKFTTPKAENIPIEILYEDDNFLAINKPAGIVVHPALGNENGTLVNAILNHCPEISSTFLDINNGKIRPGIVHRLDKDTSGVLIIAKNKKTLDFLADEFKNKRVKKTYKALVFGQPKKSDTLRSYLGRDKNNRKKIVATSSEKGKLAITNFVSKRYFFIKKLNQSVTLVSINIPTGRTHQIRTQFKSVGHSIIGDQTYFTKESHKISKILGVKRQLLHAEKIEFSKPFSGKNILLSAKIPNDFQLVIDNLNNHILS